LISTGTTCIFECDVGTGREACPFHAFSINKLATMWVVIIVLYNSEESEMTESLKVLILREHARILSLPMDYMLDYDEFRKVYKDVLKERCQMLSDSNSGTESINLTAYKAALDDMRKALRFLSYTLADHAIHHQAKRAAFLNNRFREDYWRTTGRTLMWLWTWLSRICTGYLERPIRILLTAIVVSVSFSIIFGLVTTVTRATTGDVDYESISFSEGLDVELQYYHYPYFSTVTLTTLGYGDLKPSHSNEHKVATFLMLLFCSLEAIAGYTILGLGVATMMRRFDGHPTAEISEWMKAYKREAGL